MNGLKITGQQPIWDKYLTVTRRFLLQWLREQVKSTFGNRIISGWDEKVWVKRSDGEADWSSNIALVLAPLLKDAPRRIAARLIEAGQQGTSDASLIINQIFGRIEEANGFLNFQLNDDFLDAQIVRAQQEGSRYGTGTNLSGQRINVEFVSADPTSPLTLSAARIAASGETLCRLLEAQGASVTREFFLNDIETTSKMRLLGESVAYFYRRSFGSTPATVEPSEEILTDPWVRQLASNVATHEGNKYLLVPETEAIGAFTHAARDAAVASQKQTLTNFGVNFDVWTSETTLDREGRVRTVLNKLKESGYAYEQDNVLWLKSTAFGDEADRPLVRTNGSPTYLASDIAYHIFKFERDFDRLINIWTAEHRMYIPRTQAALKAASCDVNKLEVLPCEGAKLLRDGTAVVGRDGSQITLDDVLEEVEADSLRYFFVLRGWDEAVNIEVETARRDDETNPAYAARLLPSRLATLIRELEAKNEESNNAPLEVEGELRRLIAVWPDEAETAALRREPQRVARFVAELTTAVRQFVKNSRPDENSVSKLDTLRATLIVVENALNILGITPRERF